MNIGFDLAQTFFIDADAVQGADSIYITGVDLYVYAKPTEGKTKSGIAAPGISVTLCDVDKSGLISFDNIRSQLSARVEYADITVDTSGVLATSFVFGHPVLVGTNQTKAFLVKFDGSDQDFKIWYNKSGDTVLGGSTKTQTTSGKVDGSLFKLTNGKDLTPEYDADLSFKIKIAKFSSLSQSYKIKNKPYEMLKVSLGTTSFIGGEEVYQSRAALTGTVNIQEGSAVIVGTGTTFSGVSVNDKIILTDGTTGYTNIRTCISVANATYLTVDAPCSFTNAIGSYYKTVTGSVFFADLLSDHIILQGSTANSSLYISDASVILGVDSKASATVVTGGVISFGVNSTVPNFTVVTPPGTAATPVINFVNSANTMSAPNAVEITLGQRQFLNQYGAKISSRSLEVTAGTPYQSFNGDLTLTTNNPYVSPFVRENDLDMFVENVSINNLTTNEESGNGLSLARYVSKTVVLPTDQKAEDLKLYANAFRPYGTDIVAYIKFRNSEDPETVDVRSWTQMTISSANTTYSNPANLSDIVELAFDTPAYGQGTLQSGQFTTSSACNVILGTSGTVNTGIAVGNLVRLYSPILPTTYFIDTVTAANTSTFTVSTAVSNASLLSTGLLVDVITNPKGAFLDNQNYNVLTYYNNAAAKFQTYDNFVVKLVMTSTDGVVIPFIDDVRAIAVSA